MPTFNAATTGSALNSSGFSITHVVSSNADRSVFACVGSSSGNSASTTAASYNSVALEELWDVWGGISQGSGHLTTAEPASGSHAFSFTLNAVHDELGAFVADYYGVNQSTPHGTPASSSDSTTTSSTTAIGSAVGELVVGGSYAGATSMTPDGAQTEICEVQNIGSFSSINGSQKAGAASVTMTWTHADAEWVAGGVSLKPAGPPLSLDQEGYRWRNDDGSETTATWKAAQDTTVTLAPDETTRLRMLVNASNDPASEQYKLQYRKVGDTGWRDVDNDG